MSDDDLPPVYDDVRVSRSVEPGCFSSFGLAVSIVGLLVGVFAVVPPEHQWALNTLTVVFALAACACCWVWIRSMKP